MTTTLIVLAHPDRRSFNGAWAEATAEASEALGHTVLWSDLASMGFDPVESPRHYPRYSHKRAFDPLKAQEEAAEATTLPEDVAAEIAKVLAADRIVLHFPLWWFAPPAILKGWFDRVFAHGKLHTVDNRFDRGLCKGKTALFCVTTGSSAKESAFNGKEGDVQMLLWPTAYTLHYLGFTVLEPVMVHGVHGYYEGRKLEDLHSRLQDAIRDQRSLVAALDDHPVWRFNPDDDFDGDGRLKPDRPSHSLFIRHQR